MSAGFAEGTSSSTSPCGKRNVERTRDYSVLLEDEDSTTSARDLIGRNHYTRERFGDLRPSCVREPSLVALDPNGLFPDLLRQVGLESRPTGCPPPPPARALLSSEFRRGTRARRVSRRERPMGAWAPRRARSPRRSRCRPHLRSSRLVTVYRMRSSPSDAILRCSRSHSTWWKSPCHHRSHISDAEHRIRVRKSTRYLEPVDMQFELADRCREFDLAQQTPHRLLGPEPSPHPRPSARCCALSPIRHVLGAPAPRLAVARSVVSPSRTA